MKSVVIPKSLSEIGAAAFSDCESLKSITIPESVTSIGEYAFGRCGALKSIIFPSGLNEICYGAFLVCESLASVDFPAGLTTISEDAFARCSSLKSVVIPSGITQIESGVFSGCNSLESIYVSLDNPVYDSRNDCNAIVGSATNQMISSCRFTVILSDVTKIGKYGFAYSKLNTIVIPERVVEIDEGAFSERTSLKSVVIPASVTRIADDAFDECHPKWSISISPDNPVYVFRSPKQPKPTRNNQI